MSEPCREEIQSDGPEATEALGRRLAERLREGGVVWLEGPLGAGKTLLAKAIFAGLGVDPDEVTSPSFTLLNLYESEKAPDLDLVHVDLYRLSGPAEIEGIGLEEFLDGEGVVLIEWPERLGPDAEPPDLRVIIEIGEGDTRRIVVESRLPL